MLRTSLITGLPGEGEAELEELCQFLRQTRIERAGVFPFFPEEGTKAAQMDHVDMEEARRRAELVVDVQSDIIDDTTTPFWARSGRSCARASTADVLRPQLRREPGHRRPHLV